MRLMTSLLLLCGTSWTSLLWAADFAPRIGDESTYEVVLPNGQGIARRRLTSYDPGQDSFEVVLEQEVSGRTQTRQGRISRTDLLNQYIADIVAFCRARQGQLQEIQFQGKPQTTCLVTKDDGVFKQEDWWAPEVPFGTVLSVKKSPLHPKAGTSTRLLSFRRGTIP